MPGTSPEETNQQLATAISNGDIDAAMSCYEADAAFVAQPGQVVTGAAVRDSIGAFIALKPTLNVELTSVTHAGDLALTTSKWTLDGRAPDGSALKLAGRGAEIMRKQADGTWRFVIDNPYGGGES